MNLLNSKLYGLLSKDNTLIYSPKQTNKQQNSNQTNKKVLTALSGLGFKHLCWVIHTCLELQLQGDPMPLASMNTCTLILILPHINIIKNISLKAKQKISYGKEGIGDMTD